MSVLIAIAKSIQLEDLFQPLRTCFDVLNFKTGFFECLAVFRADNESFWSSSGAVIFVRSAKVSQSVTISPAHIS